MPFIKILSVRFIALFWITTAAFGDVESLISSAFSLPSGSCAAHLIAPHPILISAHQRAFQILRASESTIQNNLLVRKKQIPFLEDDLNHVFAPSESLTIEQFWRGLLAVYFLLESQNTNSDYYFFRNTSLDQVLNYSNMALVPVFQYPAVGKLSIILLQAAGLAIVQFPGTSLFADGELKSRFGFAGHDVNHAFLLSPSRTSSGKKRGGEFCEEDYPFISSQDKDAYLQKVRTWRYRAMKNFLERKPNVGWVDKRYVIDVIYEVVREVIPIYPYFWDNVRQLPADIEVIARRLRENPIFLNKLTEKLKESLPRLPPGSARRILEATSRFEVEIL